MIPPRAPPLALRPPRLAALIAACLGFALGLASPPAPAAPPLLPLADIGDRGLAVWWREGELLVGFPDAPGRPGWMPLVSDVPRVLPADMAGWTRIGEACPPEPRGEAKLGEQAVTAEVVAVGGRQVARLRAGDTVLAENTLGRPVEVCAVHLAQADALPGLEVLIAWRFGTGEAQIRGLTAYRVPQTAQ